MSVSSTSNNMYKIDRLKKENASKIVKWCSKNDADFLRQWAGRGYEYPLTEKQITDRLDDGVEIFEASLDGEIVGTIEIVNVNEAEKSVLIGRFVIDPEKTGKGIGTAIIGEMKAYCKNKGYEKLMLNVFDFNLPAIGCYEKCGFKEIYSEYRPNGRKALLMEVKL